jgi:hypothetical protein
VRHTTILTAIVITCAMLAVGCGGGIQPTSFGWSPTDTGWTGGASAQFTPTDAGGIDGKASVNVTLAGEQYTVAIDTLIDERSVEVIAGWGSKTTVSTCYDGPEELPEVCTHVTPSTPGQPGEVCVTLGGVSLPCYVIPAGEPSENPGVLPDSDNDADAGNDAAAVPANGGYPEPVVIDAALDTPSIDPDPVGSQPVAIPRMQFVDAGGAG